MITSGSILLLTAAARSGGGVTGAARWLGTRNIRIVNRDGLHFEDYVRRHHSRRICKRAVAVGARDRAAVVNRRVERIKRKVVVELPVQLGDVPSVAVTAAAEAADGHANAMSNAAAETAATAMTAMTTAAAVKASAAGSADQHGHQRKQD